MEKEEEIIEQLKQISLKLDALNNREEDKNFQLDMLKVQVRQSNVIMLITLFVSIAVSFSVTLLAVSMTGIVSEELLSLWRNTVFLQYLVAVAIFGVLLYIIDYLQMKDIDKLKPKKK
jgi:hypothetical protein